jgi:hypothetical protein
MNITNAKIKALIKKGESGRYAAGNGLYLRISSGATAFWVVRYIINKKRRESTPGKYPDISLAEANAEASSIKVKLTDGFDPLVERKKANNPTFKVVNDIAKYTLDKVNNPYFKVIHTSVDKAQGLYDFGVSLQSYYAWPNPIESLEHSFSLLNNGASFVIAAPNPSLDQKKLFKSAQCELMWHPDYEAFKEHNMQLANQQGANFVYMNVLVEQLQMVGFMIDSCHQSHYEGEVNFVVCHKPKK